MAHARSKIAPAEEPLGMCNVKRTRFQRSHGKRPYINARAENPRLAKATADNPRLLEARAENPCLLKARGQKPAPAASKGPKNCTY